MEHVIEINSFYTRLKDFINCGEWHVLPNITIHRYFECLTINFRVDITTAGEQGSPSKTAANILPRIEASSLKFQVNVNVTGEVKNVEGSLSLCIAEFFTCACVDNVGTFNEFIKKINPEKATTLFFCEGSTLLLRISD